MTTREAGRGHRAAAVVRWSAGVAALGDGTFRSASPLLGRVIAGFRVFGNGAGLLGAFLGGVLAAGLGVAAVPWFAAGSMAAVALPLGCYLMVRRRP